MLAYKFKKRTDKLFAEVTENYDMTPTMDVEKWAAVCERYFIDIKELDRLFVQPLNTFFYIKHNIPRCVFSLWSTERVVIIQPTIEERIFRLRNVERKEYDIILHIEGLEHSVQIHLDAVPYTAGIPVYTTKNLYDRWRTTH